MAVENPEEARPDAVQEFRERRDTIRTDMGGPARVEKLRETGRHTVRERIALLVDPGSFDEVGTFARSIRPEDAAATPGDGKVGGWAAIDGRPVVVAGDDITVKRASSSVVGGRKLKRLFEIAIRDGVPLVLFGEAGGARIPDMMGSAGFAEIGPLVYPCLRQRQVPLATVIVGESFGASSFLSTVSDLRVQVRGSCLAVSSPPVIRAATGGETTAEELGGADVHAQITGLNDVIAESDEEACAIVQRFLAYLPSNATQPPPRRAEVVASEEAERIGELVPENRRRAYDMHRVIDACIDQDSWFELGAEFGPSLLTGLARIGGFSVGVIANQPTRHAGVLTPDACDKATRLICLCDAFGLPLVFPHDTPGFLIGQDVEHDGLLAKAMLLKQAVVHCSVPMLSVMVRKSFGLANHVMAGTGMGADLLCAWPGAEISFMDPGAASSVLGRGAAEDSDDDALERVTRDARPYGAAGTMQVDEIIDPADTRTVLLRALERAAARPRDPFAPRPLASWPMCW